MDWRWIIVLAACASAAAWYVVAERWRKMQRSMAQMRRMVRELSLRSEQLSSAREAEKASKTESARRAVELRALRDRVAALTQQAGALTLERDRARADAAGLRVRVADLSTRLAKADVRREALEKEIAALTLVRLELQSKLRSDESQRISALNQLRRPSLAPPRSPTEVPTSDSRALSPLPVTKSPSESQLLSLEPDLTVSDGEEDNAVRAFEREGLTLERRLEERLESERRRAVMEHRPAGLNIMSVPTVELGKSAVSAAAVQSVRGLARDEGGTDASGKGPRSSPVPEEQGTAHCAARHGAKTPFNVEDEGTNCEVDDHGSPVEDVALIPHVSQLGMSSADTALSDVASKVVDAVIADVSERTARMREAPLTDVVADVVEDLFTVIVRCTESLSQGHKVTKSETATSSPPSGSEQRKGEKPKANDDARGMGTGPRRESLQIDVQNKAKSIYVVDSMYRELDECIVSSNSGKNAVGHTKKTEFDPALEGSPGKPWRSPSVDDMRILAPERRFPEESVALRNAVVDEHSGPLSLGRLPWVDFLSPRVQPQDGPVSLATALKPLLIDEIGIVVAATNTYTESAGKAEGS